MLEKTLIATEEEGPCPVEAIAEIIGQKWVSLIIRDLAEGPQRFGALQHSIKISPRVLSARLHEMEMQGLVLKKIFAEVPPHTEYSLTGKGQLLVPLIDEMRRVGHKFI